jgi:hypothetical protein
MVSYGIFEETVVWVVEFEVTTELELLVPEVVFTALELTVGFSGDVLEAVVDLDLTGFERAPLL